VTVASLERDAGLQLTLPLDGYDAAALDAALDGVRERFGADAITRATLVNDDRALQPWLMPGEGALENEAAPPPE